MAAAAASLPRHITTAPKPFRDALLAAKVNDVCAAIWEAGKAGGRTDTYIGIINSQDWAFYLAPCFGLAPGTVNEGSAVATAAKIAKGDFPDDTDVMQNSTSSADATMVKVKKSVLEACYGKGNICYAELDPIKGFDGQSHKALNRWIRENRARLHPGDNFWDKALGFAIQRDKVGYYIRFASTLNLNKGQNAGGGATFVKRQVMQQVYFLGCIKWGFKAVDAPKRAIEDRDLPREWTLFVEKILCRDLKLASISYELIKSRGEDQMSRLTRVGAPIDAGDFKSNAHLV